MDLRVTELHCIMPMANIASVVTRGILSYDRAAKLAHQSVAMQPVQDKRGKKRVPGGLKLHQYANLYFHARNPMLFKRKSEAENLCVLRVSTDVLALDDAMLSDRNAASRYVRFLSPEHWTLHRLRCHLCDELETSRRQVRRVAAQIAEVRRSPDTAACGTAFPDRRLRRR
jgi:hypothetical protein